MALISKITIAEVNSRLDAVGVIGDYVRLEKKSGRWWGRCPFHGAGQERTPSFKVDPDLKMYHCFGCNKGGSVISFVMEMEKISYPEAIKNLAGKMNIEIIYEEGAANDTEQDNSRKQELYELYKRTTVTFRHFLTERSDGKEALQYLEERGISKEMIEEFQLGYSPSDRNFLFNFLKQKGYSDDFLASSGLFSSKNVKSPMFSGRLMFPITDKQGRIVAFGGRALPKAENQDSGQIDGNEPPKYINSPETEIYKKSQTLFAIEMAKPLMRQTKTVYIAEGYMDVIALHQTGITNSVAPLGTAFTDDQAKWLSRWVENVVLIFDNDEAGHKAAYKAIITCRKNGLSCCLTGSIAAHEGINFGIDNEGIEIFKDPAEILQKKGSQILKKVLKFTINDFEYLISRSKLLFIAAEGDINKAAEFMFPYLNALDSEIDLSDSITRIADNFKIERSSVNKEYLIWKGNIRETDVKQADSRPAQQISRNEELSLLANVALNMELYSEFRAGVEIREVDDRSAKELFVALEECYKRGESGTDSLLEKIKDEELKIFISNIGTTGEFKGDPRKFMEDGINRIKKKKLEKRLVEINAQMRESEREPRGRSQFIDEAEIDLDELLAEKKIIDSQIRKLEGR